MLFKSSNCTIAKNTLFLYLGNFIQLLIGLYISRAILNILGVEDFGIYGIVSGTMTLLCFLNLSMSSASSRFITFEQARGTLFSKRTIFSTVYHIHLTIALISLIAAETIGLWFVYNKMLIPEDRFYAAMWVYQFSVFTGLISIVQVPYLASITAHEHMFFFSIWGTFGTLAKLICTLLLPFINSDKLILYSFLLLCINLIVALGYRIYCKRYFVECFLVKVPDRKSFKNILTFSGLNTISSLSSSLRTQGSNLIINTFWGVAINASCNIANAASSYILSFSSNIINAFRPQIIKCYAENNIAKMQSYLHSCIKFSVFIFCIISTPVFLNTKFVLSVWLGHVPEGTAIICKIMLISNFFALINMIFIIAIQATSNIKNNCLSISFASLISVILLYYLFQKGYPFYYAFIVYTATEIAISFIVITHTHTQIPQITIAKTLLLLTKLIIVIICATAFTNTASSMLPARTNTLLSSILIHSTILSFLFYHIILSKTEKKKIGNILNKHYD